MEIIEEFKIIWGYLKNYKKAIAKITLLAMFVAVITAVIPYIYGVLVDTVSIEAFSINFVFAILGIWLTISIVSAFLGKIISQRSSFLSIDVANDIICENAAHIIALPLKFHKEKKIGEIFSKIDRASMSIARITDEIIFWMLPRLVTVLIGILILFSVEWRLAVGTAILFFGYILITIYKTSPIIQKQKNLNKAFEQAYGNLYDSFLNIQTIKSFAAEDLQVKKYKKDFRKDLNSAYKEYMTLWHFLALWQQLFFGIGFVILFSFSILLLRENTISSGQLIMFLGYLNLTYEPLKFLSYQWKSFKTGMTTIKRTEKLLDIKPENYQKEGKIIEKVKGMVEFKNIGFGYKKQQEILTDISFIAEAGQKIAIVGGSGEGKTTLVDLIPLYSIPTKGEIKIDGVDIKKLNLQFLRSLTAYVPQEVILFNDTIENNIRYGNPKATDQEIITAAKIANAHNFIMSFSKKYKQLVGERGIKLSMGQKQRLAIARAIIHNPKILILDEATSSLDSESEKLVQEALEKLITNRTTFIIAHRLSTIKKADKILVLKNGKIAEQGTHQELIQKKGIYFKFYSLQFKI